MADSHSSSAESDRISPSAERMNSGGRLLLSAVAAFCVYFCMNAFRKPFAAATFEGPELFGLGLKTVLVLAQLLGYTVSKFIGIKVVSEMRHEYRALAIVGLLAIAELALVGFAFLPRPLKVVMMFLNGMPLGMIFGLVLSYLEGRKQTEALSAALCASFIVASGVLKSVGSWLMQDLHISEFAMPMTAGAIFFIPLVVSVWLLQLTPPPDAEDRFLRSERKAMSRDDRRQFLYTFWPGISLLVVVYIAVTIARTLRDDFAVEIWRDMGVSKMPSVFTTSETWVAAVTTACLALTILVKNNFSAMRLTMGMMCGALVLVMVSAWAHRQGVLSPIAFMVMCGVGLYVPYVAFHTSVFERLIAAARMPSNLGFLMYMADSIGYLGYAAIIVAKTWIKKDVQLLPYFQWTLLITAFLSIVSLLAALMYFQRTLVNRRTT